MIDDTLLRCQKEVERRVRIIEKGVERTTDALARGSLELRAIELLYPARKIVTLRWVFGRLV